MARVVGEGGNGWVGSSGWHWQFEVDVASSKGDWRGGVCSAIFYSGGKAEIRLSGLAPPLLLPKARLRVWLQGSVGRSYDAPLQEEVPIYSPPPPTDPNP